jgi:hypothetical protein
MKKTAWLTVVFLMVLLGALLVRAQDTPEVPESKEELLKAADEVLEQVSRLRQLEVKSPVEKGVRSREEIRSYLMARIQEEYQEEELRIEGRLLKKLRLIPEDMDVYEYALNLLTEQVAGYYDPKAKTFYLADWLSLDVQKPIMAHELTHALQDQHFDVEPFLKRIKGNDDVMLARSSVLEGDAVAVMIDYMMEPMGMTFLQIPDLKQFMAAASAAVEGEYQIFATAPRYFRETLIFPYTSGLSFIQSFREKHSWADVRKLYEDLPKSSEQILHPEKYLQEPRDEPTEVPAKGVGLLPQGSWKSIYDNVLGEFTMQLVLKEFLEDGESEKAAAGWGGDLVELLRDDSGRESLAMRSVWDTERDAVEFFEAYAKLIGKKYPQAVAEQTEPASRRWKSGGDTVTLTRSGTWVELAEW